jgi:RNA polymerase sigma factor (sigma-70 family)
MDPAELSDLIRRARSGEPAATDRLLSIYVEPLHRSIGKRMGRTIRQRVESMDIVQSAMGQALLELPRFEVRGPGSLFRWLRRVAENTLHRECEYWRAQRRRIGLEVPLGDSGSASDGPVPAGGDPTPSSVVAHREREAFVRAEVERLEEPLRTVITLHQSGLSDAQIALRLGRSDDAVRRLRHRALQSLAQRLERLQE